MTITGTDPTVVAAVSFHRLFPGGLHPKQLPVSAQSSIFLHSSGKLEREKHLSFGSSILFVTPYLIP